MLNRISGTIVLLFLILLINTTKAESNGYLPQKFLLQGVKDKYHQGLLELNSTLKSADISLCSHAINPLISCFNEYETAKYILDITANKFYGVIPQDEKFDRRNLSKVEKIMGKKLIKYLQQHTRRIY